MAIHKIDGVDGVNHFPRKFVTLTAAGTLIGCSTGSAPAVLSAANTTTRAFAVCTKAFTTDPTVNYTDGEIMIFDHGFYG